VTDIVAPPDDPMANVSVDVAAALAEVSGNGRLHAAVREGRRPPSDLDRLSQGRVRSIASVATEFVSFATDPGARFRTGLSFVDKITRGTAPGEVTTLLAPSNTGKTTILCNIAANNPTAGIVFFTIEMPEMLVVPRLFSILFDERYKDLERRIVGGDGVLKAQLVEDLAEQLPHLGLVGRGGPTIGEMDDIISEYEDSFQLAPQAILVDYLDLIGGGTEGVESSKRKFNDLRELAKRRTLSVLVAHQVTGAVLDSRMGQVPRFNDGRYAGAAEPDHLIGAARRINDDEVKADPRLYSHERWTIDFNILKTRSDEPHAAAVQLGWNPHTLRITPEYDHEARMLWEPPATPAQRARRYVQQPLPEEEESDPLDG